MFYTTTPTPVDNTHCAGGCGRTVQRPHFTCPACWSLLPEDLRRAIAARRGAMRQALTGQAREWLQNNVRSGELVTPSAKPAARFTLARRGEAPPAASPPADELPALFDESAIELPAGRVEVTRIIAHGRVTIVDPPEPLTWHTFVPVLGVAVLVLSRPDLTVGNTNGLAEHEEEGHGRVSA